MHSASPGSSGFDGLAGAAGATVDAGAPAPTVLAAGAGEAGTVELGDATTDGEADAGAGEVPESEGVGIPSLGEALTETVAGDVGG